MTKPQFICYAILDKNGELLLEKYASYGPSATVEATVEILNSTTNLNNDERAPYKAVALYYDHNLEQL